MEPATRSVQGTRSRREDLGDLDLVSAMLRVPNWVDGRCLPGKAACLFRNESDLVLPYPFTAGVYGSRIGLCYLLSILCIIHILVSGGILYLMFVGVALID